ncbi:rna-directed dna polymerase from mobile element jockey-like [Pitangus sulphuratus]|nr:rna-directed dna polymerase from mobile element jockey-like [Pitangus sulphuratus]
MPGKVMECLILEIISLHMEDKKVIRSSQLGFTKGKSYLTNQITFYNETTAWMDEGKAADIVYLNFSKAFKTVSPNIFIGKLRKDWMSEKLERWTEKNCLKFNKDKCRILHLGNNNPMDQYRLGADLLESSSVDKDLGVMVSNRLSMSQQRVFVAKMVSGILESIRKSIVRKLLR